MKEFHLYFFFFLIAIFSLSHASILKSQGQKKVTVSPEKKSQKKAGLEKKRIISPKERNNKEVKEVKKVNKKSDRSEKKNASKKSSQKKNKRKQESKKEPVNEKIIVKKEKTKKKHSNQSRKRASTVKRPSLKRSSYGMNLKRLAVSVSGIADDFPVYPERFILGKKSTEDIIYPHLQEGTSSEKNKSDSNGKETNREKITSIFDQLAERLGSDRTMVNIIVLSVLFVIFALYRLRVGGSRKKLR